MQVPEKWRVTSSYQHPVYNMLALATDASYGNEGAFLLPSLTRHKGRYFLCLACPAAGWEHVSVSIPGENRTPTWEEMCYIKSVFWDDDETVMQLHPPKKDWVNNHPYCLHLWRPTDKEIPLPDSIMVGRKNENVSENKTK